MIQDKYGDTIRKLLCCADLNEKKYLKAAAALGG